MIGITWRGKLGRLVLQHYLTGITGFEQDVINLASLNRTQAIDDDEFDSRIQRAMTMYANQAHKNVFDELTEHSPELSVKLSFEAPAVAGYPDYPYDQSYNAGITYAMAYHAATGRYADPGDCNDLTEQVSSRMRNIIIQYLRNI